MEKVFMGKVPLKYAYAPFAFTPNSVIQKLLHHAKYSSNQSVSVWLGKLVGSVIKHSKRRPRLDLAIPVPLHPKKFRKRGFNQAELIAQGLAEVLEIRHRADLVIRRRNNPSQTTLSRYERAVNSQDLFGVTQPEQIWAKDIILVDDVCTSGATLCALAEEIEKFKPASISFATVAMA